MLLINFLKPQTNKKYLIDLNKNKLIIKYERNCSRPRRTMW